MKNIDDLLPIDLELEENSPSSLTSSTLLDSTKTEEVLDNDSVLSAEYRESGSVQFDVYSSYWKAMGFMLCVAILLSLLLMQVSRNMSDWWLSYWVTNAANDTNSTNTTEDTNTSNPVLMESLLSGDIDDSVRHYLILYGVLAGLNSLFTLLRAFLFAYGGIVAATKIHKCLLKSIIKVIPLPRWNELEDYCVTYCRLNQHSST